MASPETMAIVWQVLRDRWPKYPASDRTMEVYYQCLQDVPDDILQHAVVQYMRTAKWFPGVSEILDQVDALFGDEQDALDAEGAWGMVSHWRKRPWDPARALPPLVKAALDVLSIKEYSTEDSLVSDRARYCARFKALKERKRSERRMLPEVRKLAEGMRMERKAKALVAQVAAKQLGG